MWNKYLNITKLSVVLSFILGIVKLTGGPISWWTVAAPVLTMLGIGLFGFASIVFVSAILAGIVGDHFKEMNKRVDK